ncbi:MAG TPA: MFS transporter [Streptosporangiaceae bacterium]|nr:MFS transporter [Streptosporangiaceae bacterium]
MTRPVRGSQELDERGGTVRRAGTLLLVAGILVLALNLRAAITSLPPVFPGLAARLKLSATAVTVLATLPVLCFGLFSAGAVPLSRRFGEERVLLGALGLLAAGLVLRGVLPGALLYPGTVIAAGAIALMNVLLPSLVKRRQPHRAGMLIGGYLLCLSLGAVLGSLLAVPAYRGTAHAAWLGGPVRFVLWLWAIPAAIAFVVWLPQARYRTRPDAVPGQRGGPAANLGAIARHPLTWQVTAFMGLQSLTYYATLSWLPTLLQDRGMTAAHAGDLLALMNFGNAVTAMLVPTLAHRMTGQRLLAVPIVVCTGAGIAGVFYAPLGSAWAFMLLLGLSQGASLGLAIFFTVARAPDPLTAASLSALAQAGGYLLATAGPLTVGLLHAATGGWSVPVALLLALCAAELAAGYLAGRPKVLPPG